jgi:hypothetical protein
MDIIILYCIFKLFKTKYEFLFELYILSCLNFSIVYFTFILLVLYCYLLFEWNY